MSFDLNITEYSERSFVVRGDTKTYKDDLKALGGKWNANLKGGGGWIYSNKARERVDAFINSGVVEVDRKQSSEITPDAVTKFLERQTTETLVRLQEKINTLLTNADDGEPEPKPVKRLLKNNS